MSQHHWKRHANSSTTSQHQQQQSSATATARAQQLSSLLSGPNLGPLPELVAALDDMTYPVQRLHAWKAVWGPCLINVADKARAKVPAELVQLWREEMHPDLIAKHQPAGGTGASTPGSRARRAAQTACEAFATAAAKITASKLGHDGELQSNMTVQAFLELWGSLHAAAMTADGKQHPRPEYHPQGVVAVERLSRWFGRYTEQQGTPGSPRVPLLLPKMLSMSNAAAFALEYTLAPTATSSSSAGSSSSSTGSHFLLADSAGPVAIHDFGKFVTTFGSKQLPKKLVVHGSDFREHTFVVKGGEDVRIDERIEQLFVVMARLARQHPGCSARRLHAALLTYDVVPASPRLGLLGFVEGTSPMLSLIERTAPKDAVHAADMAYAQAFTPTRAAPGHAPYTNAWARRDDVMLEVLHKAQRELPWDALRHCLRRRARHPEAWLAMRAAYAASLASSSAAGYLVGLGDRHLANLLVVEGTGAVVPIDFGYAFGTAVLALPIAELVPFRLTRQVANVLQPHSASGLLKPAMAAWIDAAAQGQQVLGSIMQVFLAEPLGEWQQERHALGQLAAAADADAGGTAGSAGAGSSAAAAAAGDQQGADVADLKVNQVRLRIAGHNPVGIICSEARANARFTSAFPAMERILSGAAAGPNSRRQQVPAQGLVQGGAEAVAEVLLELATDELLLCRAYQGWRPYL